MAANFDFSPIVDNSVISIKEFVQIVGLECALLFEPEHRLKVIQQLTLSSKRISILEKKILPKLDFTRIRTRILKIYKEKSNPSEWQKMDVWLTQENIIGFFVYHNDKKMQRSMYRCIMSFWRAICGLSENGLHVYGDDKWWSMNSNSIEDNLATLLEELGFFSVRSPS